MVRTPTTERDRARLVATLGIIDALAADLRAVLEKGWPSAEELAELGAPILEDWRRGECFVDNLRGEVSGHPHLDGEISTSPLHAICERAGVARTERRWYRLGSKQLIFPAVELAR